MKINKPTNPEYPYMIKAIMDAIDRHYGKTATGPECGMILQKAETVGFAIVAIAKSATWPTKKTGGYYNYMPKVRRELSGRGSWADEFNDQAKVENNKFEEYMNQKFGNKLADVIGQIGKEVK